MEDWEGAFGGAIAFTILNVLIIVIALIGTVGYCSLFYGLGSMGFGVPANQECRERVMAISIAGYIFTLFCAIIPGLIACIVIMWQMYYGNMKFGDDDEQLFWIIAIAPCVGSFVLWILCFIFCCSATMHAQY